MSEFEKELVQKIRNDYTLTKREETKFEELKNLDRKVKNPAIIFAYVYGTISSLILGTGMCFAMKVIGNLMPLGIVIGVLGLIMVSTTYSIYNLILNKRKAKYSKEIIAKSDELLNA